MITPSNLFVRFLKECNVYKPIMVYTYMSHNKRYFYYGIIEDRLNQNNILVRDMFPVLINCGTTVTKNWIAFLNNYNEEEINYIPKPSENWNDIPDNLLKEFKSKLNPNSEEYKLVDDIIQYINTLNDNYALCKLIRKYQIPICKLMNFFNRILTKNTNQIIFKLEDIWKHYLVRCTLNANVIY